MKPKSKLYNAAKIACLILCLLMNRQTGICQNVTRIPTTKQLIVRDLQICDQITIERDILKAYNSSLLKQVEDQAATRIQAERDRDKYKAKTKRRGKTIAVFIAVAVVRTVILIL
ncbi:hypothetical protein [Dyadobacter psychrotolerans]|uniref:Uncharacterized protein n=1 Tax=Dyadobacter psychrotolerans TaxID=2541721 RepID=A0A4R5DP06_9BACT|nr:hypothetical protein [Dyadobacter psychrotolerans]TDE15297.1 hypothetical protein E0F88_12295 [Dyadobacter psychrotolerans]